MQTPQIPKAPLLGAKAKQCRTNSQLLARPVLAQIPSQALLNNRHLVVFKQMAYYNNATINLPL